MTPLRSGRALPRLLTLAILAGALLLRLLVPQGWMPVAGADGWRIAPCSGHGPMAMTAHRGMIGHHGGAGHDDGAPDDHPCPFASLAAPLAPPPPSSPLLIAALIPPPPAWLGGLVLAGGHRPAAPPPPSTGPPAR